MALDGSEIASFVLPQPSSSVVGASRGQRRRHILLTLTQAVQIHDAESRQILKSWTTKPSAPFTQTAVWRDGRIYAVQKRNTLISWAEADDALDRAKTRSFDGEISCVRALERGAVLVVTAAGAVSACDPATLAIKWTESLLDGEAAPARAAAVAEHVFAHSSAAGDGVYAVLRSGHEHSLAVHVVVHDDKAQGRRLLLQGSFPLPAPAAPSKKQYARIIASDLLPSASTALALLWSDGTWEVHAFEASPLAQKGASLSRRVHQRLACLELPPAPAPAPKTPTKGGAKAGEAAAAGVLLAAVGSTHVAIAGTRAGSAAGEKVVTLWDAVYGSAHAVHPLAEADEGAAPAASLAAAPLVALASCAKAPPAAAAGGAGAGPAGYVAVCGPRSVRACAVALRAPTLAAALAGRERTRALVAEERLAAGGVPLQAAPLDLRGVSAEADLPAAAAAAAAAAEREGAAVRALLDGPYESEDAFLAALRPLLARHFPAAPAPATEPTVNGSKGKKGRKQREAEAAAAAAAEAAAGKSPSKGKKNSKAGAEGPGLNAPYVEALVAKCCGAGHWRALEAVLATGRVRATSGLLTAVLEARQAEALERVLLRAAGVAEWDALRALRFALGQAPAAPHMAALARAKAPALAAAPQPAALLARDTPAEHLLRAVVCLPRSDLFMVQCLRTLSARETAVMLVFLRKWLRRYERWREGEWRAAAAAAGERVPSLGHVLDWAGMLLDAQFAALAVRPELQALVADVAALCRELTLACARLAPLKDYLDFIVSEKGPLPSRPIGPYTVELVEL